MKKMHNTNFHAKSQVPSSKNGRVMAVGTKEDISISYLNLIISIYLIIMSSIDFRGQLSFGYGVCQYITPHTERPPE